MKRLWLLPLALLLIAAAALGPALIQATSIELGAAGTTDTTIARVGAGVISVESVSVLTTGTGLSVVGVQAFTSGTAATYTPTAGSKFYRVICTGGGGEGGGSDDDGGAGVNGIAGGGEGGGTTIAWMTAAEMGANAVYTIGAGGDGGGSGTGGTDGGDGADTTFNAAGTHADLIAAGGDGGTGTGVAAAASQLSSGGDGEGTATGGDVNIVGGAGNGGSTVNDGTNAVGGHGGAGGGTFWGPGAAGVVLNSSSGIAAGAAADIYGTGGQGGMSADVGGTGGAGGNGMSGICVIEEFG